MIYSSAGVLALLIHLIINYDEKDHEYDCITRVNNSRTVIFNEKKASEFCGFPFPAGLDVYPLDYVVGYA